MLPLRVAILWHQHQPYYKKDDIFILPWVRLHGVKDYYDLPALVGEYPAVKQIINLVPSLLMQIQDYVEHRATDRIEQYTLVSADDLTQGHKRFILDYFFLCNADRMILPYDRYRELYERSRNEKDVLQEFTSQDWRDIQMWYNLTWIGPISRKREDVQQLLKQGRDYTEEQKHLLLDIHRDILAGIIPVMKKLQTDKQIEISVTPKYHPILPLLCDSDSARVAMPDMQLPAQFCHPEDARHQVQSGIEVFRSMLECEPHGMWPSEGSVSDEALAIIAEAGLQWAATDEGNLRIARAEQYHHLDLYYPWLMHTASGDLTLFFRDHILSDLIGFVYSNWKPFDAAANFCERLKHIRETIVQEHGEEALHHAVVPIILDGENCWEYYEDNGAPFLRELFSLLSSTPELRTVTCSDVIREGRTDKVLKHIHPGSWINANFKIWIGHEEDNDAWTLLGHAREAVGAMRGQIPPEQFVSAMEALYIAEGSDWYWWYGDDHVAANQHDFDILFRWYIEQAYRRCGLLPPDEVYMPINNKSQIHVVIPQSGIVRPCIDGKTCSEHEWEHAGYYDAVLSAGAMHHAVDLFKRLWFAAQDSMLYFRCDITRPLHDDEHIVLECTTPKKAKLIQGLKYLTIELEEKIAFERCAFAVDEIVELAIPRHILFPNGNEAGEEQTALQMQIHIHSHYGVMSFPPQGALLLTM